MYKVKERTKGKMEKVIFTRERIDEREVKQKYLQRIDGDTFHWTSNRNKALKIDYSVESLLCGEISNIKDSLQEEYYKTYTITLGEDGSVQTTATSSEILSSSWGLSTSGEVDIKIVDIATQTTNSGVNWSGTVDNIKNPTKITGYTNRWNFNTVGYFDGNSYAFEMTK